MTDWMIPPAFIMLGGAVLLPFLPKKIRSIAFLLVTFTTLVSVFMLPVETGPDAPILTAKVMNYTMVLCKADKLSKVFGIIFAFIAFAGGFYGFHIKETGQQVAALLYAGGALGVTFAGDFFTLFIYWEMMAVASTYLIWARRTKESQNAGIRYLLYHVLGGGLLFMGILLHITKPDASLLITQMKPEMGLSAWLMLLGVVINAAVPPLHTWLADAYPKATVTGAVFLSAFTTKTAVYVLARVFPGWEVLLIAGVIMTLYGVIFAVLANDIRGILAYHIISQVGYMVAGVGIGTEMAINGATAHAFSHILYKALLFMGAGTVLYTTGKSKLTKLGGLWKSQPWVGGLYLVAGFSISGLPLFNGFISKSMTVAAAGEAHHDWALLLMTLAAVGTWLSVGLKLPYFTWFSKEKPADLEVKKPPLNMYIGMGVVAFFCIFHGVYPAHLYQWLPFEVHWSPFTMHHFVETVQILVFTFVAFWIFRFKLLKPKPYIALDLDWFFRKPARIVQKIVVDPWTTSFDWIEEKFFVFARKLIEFNKNPYLPFSKDKSDNVYTPDRYRPPAQKIVLAVLLIFVLVVFLGLFL
jgi:multicomponent Na+:H+ antiporter subunit D